jgi:tetratricopeptide (TPR) repeat protein/cytoskeletal protein CcmA (bactofilin family)
MDSYFESGVKLVGTLWVKGLVHFDGELEGEIYSTDHFMVGKSGMIFGDIKTHKVTNMGKVRGNIIADNKVSLANESSLIGDITTYHLVIDEGSNFEGSCKMVETSPISPEATIEEEALVALAKKKLKNKKPVGGSKKGKGSGKKKVAAYLAILGLSAAVYFTPDLQVDKLEETIKQGHTFIKEKKYSKAESKFQKALKISNESPEVFFGLGKVHFSRGNYDQALSQFRRSVELNPSNSSYQMHLAKTLFAKGDLEEAKVSYQSLVKLDPNSYEGYQGLGVLERKLGNLDEAIKNLEMAISLKPDYFEPMLALGKLLIQKGDKDRALVVLSKAVDLNDEDPISNLNLGELLLELNKGNEAIKSFKKVAGMFPQNFEAQIKLADWYFQKGSLEESLRYYKAAQNLEPQNGDVHSRLGKIYLDKKLNQKAKAAFKKAINLKPESWEDFFQLGRILNMEKKWDEAIQTLEFAKKLDPRNHKILFEMGKAFFSKEQFSNSTRELTKATSLFNQNPNYYILLAESLVGQKELDKAVSVLKQATAFVPKSSELAYTFCNLYSKKGYYTVAIGYCKNATELKPDFYDAMNRLAWLFAKKRINLEEALVLSNKTLGAFPKKPGYVDTLSEIYYVKGDIDQAITTIKLAIKLDPTESYYKKQLWKFKNVKPKPISG